LKDINRGRNEKPGRKTKKKAPSQKKEELAADKKDFSQKVKSEESLNDDFLSLDDIEDLEEDL
jgi:hypothetical protein